MVEPRDFFTQRPERVAMVGLGPSANAFWLENAQFNASPPYDAVWVVNRAAMSFRHDAAFNMHDLRRMVKKYPQEYQHLAQAEKPIITLKHYPEFPMSVEFPIQDVLKFANHDIMNSGPAYMVYYALMTGVKEILLYGMDFHYENIDRAESGGQGMAYALGMAQALGVHYKIPSTSSLLDAYRVQLVDGQPLRPLYGYSESDESPDPRIKADSNVVAIRSTTQMSAEQPRYRLGEAEAGDAAAAGGR